MRRFPSIDRSVHPPVHPRIGSAVGFISSTATGQGKDEQAFTKSRETWRPTYGNWSEERNASDHLSSRSWFQ